MTPCSRNLGIICFGRTFCFPIKRDAIYSVISVNGAEKRVKKLQKTTKLFAIHT